MARIRLIDKQEANLLIRMLFHVAERVTGRLTGKTILTAPLRAHAHSTGLFWGLAMMENAQGSAATVSPHLKTLASLRVSTLVGCPF